MRFRKVAVIGGGASGLAAARTLSLEQVSFEIDLYERSSNVGGVWNYKNEKKQLRELKSLKNDINAVQDHVTPMYRFLETNLRNELMEFADVHFPNKIPMFPSRQQVQDYLEKYKTTISQKVNFHFNREVTSLVKKGLTWELTSEDTNSGQKSDQKYDAVIVANGHFDAPYIPRVEGLEQWHKLDPASITHSKYFDNPEQIRDKIVLIIGDSASGMDIAMQATYSAKKVYISSREKSKLGFASSLRATIIGMITKYLYGSNRSVTDVDGNIIENIDLVIFCTGYLYSVPFLKSYVKGSHLVIDDGSSIHELFKQIFYIYDPSLAFIGLPQMVVPMPLCEYQSLLVAKYFAGKLELPDTSIMLEEYKKEIESKGLSTAFHKFGFPGEVNYCNDLKKYVDEHSTDLAGLRPKEWTERLYNERDKIMEVKGERFKKMIDHINQLKDEGREFDLLVDDDKAA